MADNFQFPADAPPDDNNGFMFPNNGFDAGYGAGDPSAAFNSGWDGTAEFLQGSGDAFGWNDPAAFNDQHQNDQHQNFQPSLASAAAQGQPLNGAQINNPSNAFNARSVDPSIVGPGTGHTQVGQQPFNSVQGSTVSPTALLTQSAAAAAAAVTGPRIRSPASNAQPHAVNPLPKGTPAGAFSIISKEDLHARFSARELNSFLSVGNEPIPFSVNGTNIPNYVPRLSRAQLAGKTNVSTKIAKRSVPKASSIKPISKAARLSLPAGAIAPKGENLESASDEYTDASESESDEEDEPRPIGDTRPDGADEATRYDTIKALWHPRTKPVSEQSIREAVKVFWDDIKTIRERWTTDQAAADKAETDGNKRDLPVLQERAKGQRHLLEIAMKAAVQHGHPTILGNFGRTKALLQILNAFLRDRNKASDYNGSLAVAILGFLSNCGAFDSQEMAQMGLDKVLQRFGTRGDAKTSALVKKVQANIGSAMPKKAAAAVSAKSPVEPLKKDALVKAAGANGLKRPLSSDVGTIQPAKKVASEATKGQDIKKAVSAKAPATAGAQTQAPKTKHNQISTKPTGFISSLQSAKKPTVTSTTIKKPAEKKALEKKPAPTQSAASSFSFASVLADVNKPQPVETKEPSKSKPDANKPLIQETEEQRAKRLRKEARRKHRVHWPSAEHLEDVRFFEHDSDEELGHDAAQTRDVKDARSEGNLFKHMRGTTLDIEDDEDGDANGGDPFIRKWREPKLVEFDVLPDSVKQSNYVPHGGGVLFPKSPEKAANEQREATTLLVVYMDDSEIPPSPKEPGPGADEMVIEPKSFGPIPNDLNEKAQDALKARQASNALSAEISSLLGSMPGLQNPAAPPAPASQLPSQDLSSLIGSFVSKQATPAPSAPFPGTAPMANSNQTPPDLSSIIAALNGGPKQQPPAPMPAPMQAPMQAPNPNGQATPFNGQDLSSLIASLNTSNGGGFGSAQHAPGAPTMGQPWMPPQNQPQWPNMGYQQQQQNAPSGVFENPERRRMREAPGGNGGFEPMQVDYNQFQGGGNSNGAPQRTFGYKTQMCMYWQQGRCKKGDNCTYRHGDE